jgi:tetratricopeptide (TPR) repeat protein
MLLLAVLCKEAGFVVPLLAVTWYAADALAARRERTAMEHRRATAGAVLVLFLCAAAVVAWRFAALGGTGLGGEHADGSVSHTAGTFARLWWYYVARVLVPVSPSIVDRWPLTRDIRLAELAAWLGWVVLALLGVRALLRGSTWVMLLAWYVLWLLPVSGLVPLRHLYAERYLYPASWGVLAGAALLVFTFIPNRRHAPHIVLSCLALALATATAYENRFWRSDEKLFAHAVEQDPNYVEGHTSLAEIALKRGEYAKSIEHSEQALRAADDPDFASYVSPVMAHTNLGLALYHLGEHEKASAHFIEANRARPDSAITHYHLGLCAAARGHSAAAREHYENALRLKPGDYLAQSNLAHVHLVSGNPAECISLLRPLIEQRPDDRLNRANFATALLMSKDFANAEVQFEELVKLEPDKAVHFAKLAWVEHAQGKSHQAAVHLEAAVGLDPDDPTVREVAEIIQESSRGRR